MRMRSRQRKNVILGILLVMVVAITIGYSALSSRLKINGTSNITSDFRVVITDIQEGTMNSSTTINKTYNETSATFQVDLKKPGSTAEYIVKVENLGKIDAILDTIEGINEANNKTPNEIKFSLEDITVGDSLNVGETKTFKVKVIYNELATTIPSTSKTLTLKLNYKQKTTLDTENPVNTLLAKTNTLLEKSESTYNYMDGTYLAGAQDSNYVWFDGFLWRIMGVNADGTIRMITEENVTAISYGASNTAEDYDNSYVNDWLNNYFYPKLKDKDILVRQTWCSQSTENIDSSRTTCENNLSKVQQYVGILSLDEYNLSGRSTSFLNSNQEFYVQTAIDSANIWYVTYNGSLNKTASNSLFGIRAIVNILEDKVVKSGSETKSDPYMFEEKNNITIGSLKDNSYTGEYVTYAGRNYRVVETSETGTKLILDGYYDSNNDGIIEEIDKAAYGTNCALCTIINEESFINWLSNNNEDDKNKLASTIWYRGGNFGYGQNYKTYLSDTSNPYEGKIGLIKIGEFLSSQSVSILFQKNIENYWTMTTNNTNMVWYNKLYGNSIYTEESNLFAIRPVINIGPDVQITGGNGTFNSPYQI